MTFSRDAARLGLVVLVYATGACARPMLATAPRPPATERPAPLLELWSEPRDLATRDLLWGAASQRDAPPTNAQYTVLRRDTSGYSPGYDVAGPDGRKWDVKVGREVQPEIVLSRILWALGYHQPANYLVSGWSLTGTWEDEGQPARFRLEEDHETDGEWPWVGNPFDGSTPMNGLIAINLLLNNWDYKTSNNRIYRIKDASHEPTRRYVVQDLGASLGKSKAFPLPLFGTRNNVSDFEGGRLIKEARGSRVVLHYRGLHRDVLERVTPADLVWACELMNRLSDAQLDDAFEAAAYPADVRQRYITKIRDKIREGLALKPLLDAQAGA
jgi:hypothetical protein